MALEPTCCARVDRWRAPIEQLDQASDALSPQMTSVYQTSRETDELSGRRGPTGLVAFPSSVFSELFNVVV
jgi:hypothetical protein